MQHGQRITAPVHIDARNCPPRPADKKQAHRGFIVHLGVQPGDGVLDIGFHSLLAAFDFAQFQRSKCRCHALAHPPVGKVGKLHRRAADITDQPVGFGPAQKHALRREPRLFAPVDDPDFDAGFAQNLFAKIHAVAGLAHSRRGHGRQRGDAHAFGQGGKAADCTDGTHPPRGVQVAGFRQPRAQGTHDFFVVEIGGRTGRAVKYHHPHRVGAHVDHPHTPQTHRGCVFK